MNLLLTYFKGFFLSEFCSNDTNYIMHARLYHFNIHTKYVHSLFPNSLIDIRQSKHWFPKKCPICQNRSKPSLNATWWGVTWCSYSFYTQVVTGKFCGREHRCWVGKQVQQQNMINIIHPKILPRRGIEPRPRRWERRILTTRPPGSYFQPWQMFVLPWCTWSQCGLQKSCMFRAYSW